MRIKKHESGTSHNRDFMSNCENTACSNVELGLERVSPNQTSDMKANDMAEDVDPFINAIETLPERQMPKRYWRYSDA